MRFPSLPKATPFLLLAASSSYAGDAAPTTAPAAEAPVVVSKSNTASNDISAEEVAGLLRQLRRMRDGLDSEERRAVAEALKALTPAANSATEAVTLWSGSVRTIEFEKQNKRSADFEEWRKRNDDKLHDAGFAAALRLQCRYLKLCLEADTEEKAARARPAIVALMEESIKAMPQCAQYMSLLREDVFSSPIAKKLGVEKQCPEGWAKAPLSIDAHFGRFVKSAITANPSDIPALWECRLKLERSHAEAVDQNSRVQRRHKNPDASPMGRRISQPKDKDEQDTKAVDAFEKEKLPTLLWSMGEDFFKAGLRRRGIETLFGVLGKYPKHSNAEGWLDRITAIAEELESKNKPPVVAEPAAPVAPETPAPATPSVTAPAAA
jgi:hypothetical protein